MEKRVFNLEKILTELRKRRREGEQKSEIRIGYTAEYAVPVHERTDLHHEHGQAKFLEQPIRTEEKKMADIIRAKLQARKSLQEAQLEAGKHLLSVSLTLVPVDTGELKASGFVKAISGTS